MAVSIFDLYSIGVGPSSSHTMGPMRAAREFLIELRESGRFKSVHELKVELFGSLAMTGKGHATDRALLLGLGGYLPESIDPEIIDEYVKEVQETHAINLLGGKVISFDPEKQIHFLKGKRLPYHTNAMRFTCFDDTGKELEKEVFYSTGGGFIISHPEISYLKDDLFDHRVPYPINSEEELLAACNKEGYSIDQLMFENEKTWRSEVQVREGILRLWEVMQISVRRGFMKEGELPGGLGVQRRAPALYHKLIMNEITGMQDHGHFMDWTSLFALAVNEENASGGQIVTAPTNGAAGVMPAVLHYYKKFISSFSIDGVITFFLAAGAIGMLFKKNASISGAEMGCQGEVGVASAMAAAGLTAALGGSNKQITASAEIAMEHHLGMTCDPVGGLVQVPCIERNSMGAIKAINASRLAMHGNGEQLVSLDAVINAMREIGIEMHSKFKETSEGGLATSVPLYVPKC